MYACIALEALLNNRDRGEISFAFALRGTHLLMQDVAMRGKLFQELKALYSLRSEIVHVGDTDITDSDIAKMRTLAKQAVFTVLVSEGFTNMTEDKEFEDWFMGQQLGIADSKSR